MDVQLNFHRATVAGWKKSVKHADDNQCCAEVAKKPTKKDKVPKKGSMVKGRTMLIRSFGTIRLAPSRYNIITI